MHRTITASLLFSLCLLAQQPTQPSPADLLPRFHRDLVQIDATVTDANGNHVDNLKAADFEVSQDRRRRNITRFAYVPQQPPRRTVLLINDCGVPHDELNSWNSALKSYFNEALRPGAEIALLRATAGAAAPHAFTSDPSLLSAAADRLLRWLPLAEPNTHCTGRLFRIGFDAMRALETFPGRKALVIIGPPIQAAEDTVRSFTDAANRASVTIHTIDARQQRFGSASYAQLAHATGGLFHKNRLDLDLRAAIEDANAYYLLGWDPGKAAFDFDNGFPPYHTIGVRLPGAPHSVRTRAGFRGSESDTAGWLPEEERLRRALFSPAGADGIEMTLTANYRAQLTGGALVEALLHIGPKGIRFEPQPDGCETVSIHVLTRLIRLHSDTPPEGSSATQKAAIPLCGAALEQVRRNGFIWRVHYPTTESGPFQIRSAVRNLRPGEDPEAVRGTRLLTRYEQPVAIAAASQFLNIPDFAEQPLAITAVELRAASHRQPEETPVMENVAFQPATDTHPALRRFTKQDTLEWRTLLHRREEEPKPLTAELQLFHEGNEIYTRTIEIPPQRGDIELQGRYSLANLHPSGRYVLAVTVRDTKPALQSWTEFTLE